MTEKQNEKQDLNDESLSNEFENIDSLKNDLADRDAQIQNLKNEISDLKTKANNYLNTASYYKSQAETHKKDFDRFKERNKNIETEAKFKACSIAAKKLVPIIDNFNSAMEVLSPEVMRGFIMIYSSLIDTLKELGVVEVNPKNEAFDPEKHDCIEVVETDDESLDNIVARIYKKGYLLAESNEIVRPATVSVYKFVSKEQ